MTIPAPISTLQELEAMIPPKLRFIEGQQEGLLAREGLEGFYLSYRNIAGAGKNPSREAQDWLLNILVPRVEGTSTSRVIGYVESLRRRQGLASRMRSFLGDQAAIGFEVLDPDTGRHLDMDPIMFNPVAVEGAKAEQLPRAYTYIRSEPKPATRFIFFTEFDFGGIRPDEVIVSYPVSDEEVELIREGKRFSDLDATMKKPQSLKIHVGDFNREIAGETLVEHFSKTMRGLVAALEHATTVLGIEPTGSVVGTTTDSFVGAVEARVGETNVSFIRSTEHGTAVRAEVEFQKQPVDSGTDWLPTKPERVHGANVAEQLLKGPLAESAKLASIQLENVLKKLKAI